MSRFLAFLLILISIPANAQNITGLVVSSCGVVPSLFKSGNPGPFTVDTTGVMCMGTTGSVSASSVNGIATSTGLVVSSCGSTTFKAGNPGPYTVDTHGNVCQ